MVRIPFARGDLALIICRTRLSSGAFTLSRYESVLAGSPILVYSRILLLLVLSRIRSSRFIASGEPLTLALWPGIPATRLPTEPIPFAAPMGISAPKVRAVPTAARLAREPVALTPPVAIVSIASGRSSIAPLTPISISFNDAPPGRLSPLPGITSILTEGMSVLRKASARAWNCPAASQNPYLSPRSFMTLSRFFSYPMKSPGVNAPMVPTTVPPTVSVPF